MLVIGAGGLATQLIEDLVELKRNDIVFWSETETKYPFIRELYPIIATDNEVIDYFKNTSKEFLLCIGKDKLNRRNKIADKFTSFGGAITSFISPFSRISPYATSFGNGTLVLNQVVIEPGVTMGTNCIVNKKANIAHGCHIGNDCEIGPAAILTGEVQLGDNCYIGTGAILHPKIRIGNNAVIAAGAVVTKHVPPNAVLSGNPAQIKYIKKHDG